MATPTYLSSPSVSILYNAITTDWSAQCDSLEIMIQKDALESTAFGDSGHNYVSGLATVEVTGEFFIGYGASSVEAIMQTYVGNTITMTAQPNSAAAVSASNPKWTITGYVESLTPISVKVGELSKLELKMKGGTYSRATS